MSLDSVTTMIALLIIFYPIVTASCVLISNECQCMSNSWDLLDDLLPDYVGSMSFESSSTTASVDGDCVNNTIDEIPLLTSKNG